MHYLMLFMLKTKKNERYNTGVYEEWMCKDGSQWKLSFSTAAPAAIKYFYSLLSFIK